MAYVQNLKKRENINYHKANTALQYLKSGYLPYLQRTIERQHARYILDIQRQMHLSHSSNFAPCYCSLNTLQPVHKKIQGNCMFGRNWKCYCRNIRRRWLCPAGFCSCMHDKLKAQNRFFNPNFENTNIQEWRSSPLQIALCNIWSNVNADIKSLKDVDPRGILQILISDMEVTSNSHLLELFKTIKQCRDEFTHSASMEITDSKLLSLLNNIFESLDHIPRCVETDEAKRLILKMKDEDWEITAKGPEKEEQRSTEKQKHLKEKIDSCRTTVIKEMRNRQNDKDQTFTQFLHEMDDSLQQIANAVNGTYTDQHAHILPYLEKKIALKEFLLKKYQKHLLEIEDGITVDEIYVPQQTMIKDENEKEPRKMETYKDMFYHGERKAKNIYIISKGKAGKTVFLKYLTSIWCRVHTSNELQDSLSEIERIMLQYEFLFYVSLYYEKKECNIHNIIIKQLFEDNSHIEVFEQLMASESHKSLIILDGLNEFILVGDGRDNIPVQDESKDYTIIKATRSWKTEMIKKSDKTIELLMLNQFTFVRKAVDSLNKRYKRVKDFMDFIGHFGVVRCQRSEPSELMLHIRLWFNGSDE